MGLLLVAFLFLLLTAVVLFLWIRERRFLKKKTSEIMSEPVWRDIVQEREEALAKRRHFRETLEKAKGKGALSAEPKG